MRGCRVKFIRRASYFFTPPEQKMSGGYWVGRTFINGGVKRMFRLLKSEWRRNRTLMVER